MKFFPTFVWWWYGDDMILGYCGAHRFYTCLLVSIAGLMEPDRTRHPHWFFFRAMKITALQSVCRLHSCGGILSWCLYFVLIVGGSLLCLAQLFDIVNLPKTDVALCSSTLANWLMPFCNLSNFYVVKLQSFSGCCKIATTRKGNFPSIYQKLYIPNYVFILIVLWTGVIKIIIFILNLY